MTYSIKPCKRVKQRPPGRSNAIVINQPFKWAKFTEKSLQGMSNLEVANYWHFYGFDGLPSPQNTTARLQLIVRMVRYCVSAISEGLRRQQIIQRIINKDRKGNPGRPSAEVPTEQEIWAYLENVWCPIENRASHNYRANMLFANDKRSSEFTETFSPATRTDDEKMEVHMNFKYNRFHLMTEAELPNVRRGFPVHRKVGQGYETRTYGVQRSTMTCIGEFTNAHPWRPKDKLTKGKTEMWREKPQLPRLSEIIRGTLP